MKTLNLIDKAFLLKKSKLFGTLDLDLLLTIADKMEEGIYRQGARVFHVDQDAHRMYLIVQGQVKALSKGREELATLSDGEFFGDEAIFNDRGREYEAVCHADTQVLSLSRSHLLMIIAECPSVAVSLLEAYTESLAFRQRQ